MDLIKPKEQIAQATEVTLGIKADLAAAAEMNMIPLKSFFQIENPTSYESNQLDFVYKFFEQTGMQTMSEVLGALGGIRQELGSKSSLSHIYNYLRVQAQIQDLEKLKRTFTNGNQPKF